MTEDRPTLPPPPPLPEELRERATEAAPAADTIADVLGRIDELTAALTHMAASIGQLLDIAQGNRSSISELRAVSGALASEQVTAHEMIRRLPCRADGQGCLVRRAMLLGGAGRQGDGP